MRADADLRRPPGWSGRRRSCVPSACRRSGRTHLCDQMSPELPVCSPPPPACTTMNASTKPLPSLSYGSKSTFGSAATAASRAMMWARGVPLGLPMPKLPLAYQASVCGSRYGPDHLAGDVDQAVGDLAGSTPSRCRSAATPVEKNRSSKCVAGRRHRLVGEVDEHDDHAHGAAQRRPLGGRAADRARGACRAGTRPAGRSRRRRSRARAAGRASPTRSIGTTPFARPRNLPYSVSSFSRSSGLGATKHGSSALYGWIGTHMGDLPRVARGLCVRPSTTLPGLHCPNVQSAQGPLTTAYRPGHR